MTRRMTKRGNKHSTSHKRFKIARKAQEGKQKGRRDERDQSKVSKKQKKANARFVAHDPFDDEMPEADEVAEQKRSDRNPGPKQKQNSHRERSALGSHKILKRPAGQLISIKPASNRELIGVASTAQVATEDDWDNEESSAIRFNPALRTFSRDLKKVIAESDVVLEVVDARDPLGTRSREVERRVFESGAGKRIVIVLNKVDLVPAHITRAWLAYLRQELPTVAFKANTQTQRGKLGRSNKFRPLLSKRPDFGLSSSSAQINDDRISTRQCVGAESLLQLLKNYARMRNTSSGDGSGGSVKQKQTITVGIVGYPNVGKSSVVNSLRRERVCAVGAKPGVTRAIREVQLDRNVRLLDSPGVVLDTSVSSDADAVLRNALEVDFADDPTYIVDAVASKVGITKLMEHYRLESVHSVNEFLIALARQSGKLKKGGVPDFHAAARRVVQDWQSGAIRYYFVPPTRHESVLNAQLVATFSREFDAETVYAANDREQLVTTADDAEMEANAETQTETRTMESQESQKKDNAPSTQVQVDTRPLFTLTAATEASKSREAEGVTQLNRQVAKRQKRMAKKKRKNEKRVNDLLSSVTGMQIDDEEASDESDSSAQSDTD